MTLQATVRAGLASIMTLAPGAVATVKFKGQSASGFRGTQQSSSALGEEGEDSTDSCSIRVSAAALSVPEDGDTVLIDDAKATVVQTRLDPVGALLWIDYQLTKPVT